MMGVVVRRLWLVALAGFPVTLLPNLCGQDYDATQSRLLNGTVLVAPGTRPPGRAVVVLYSSINIQFGQTSTSSSGSFSFSGVNAGNYRVVARLAGYEEGSAEVSVYPHSTLTTIPPILLNPSVNPGSTPTGGIVPAAELRLGKQARSLYRKAQEALEHGKFEVARTHFERLINSEPTFAPAYHFLGVSESFLGNYTQAEAAFLRAIQLDPRRADSYFGLGRALNLLNRPGEALPMIERGLQLSPNSTSGLFEKSRAQFSVRDFVSAERTARESLAQTPPPPSEIHLVLANSYLNLRRYQEAATELDLYLKLEPRSTSAAKAKEVLARLQAAGITPKAPREINAPPH